MDGDRRPRGGDGPERDAGEPETVEDRLARLVRDGRFNALAAWTMIAVLTGVLVESALDYDLLSAVIVVGLGAVVLAPTVAARDWRAMLPAELVGLALLPVLVRAVFGGELGTFATYVAIAALALVVTVDLHMFTSLRVTHWFAVVFVVMATLATAAVWTVLRWNLDQRGGTAYLTTNDALMIEWLYVTLAGLAAGLLFDGYFRGRGRRLRRAIRRVVRR
ncbi:MULTISPECIES: hypothetical protein [Halorubrum]|jgi:hypothetical protein|uniref:Uncharacterized protein n=1 Tax=Halorubrum tropicale TaxID=1765655 RepID=A0A0M9AS73_9EURY|nr:MULTISPECIES: hypothetical protein [Halorubrum]KOX96441.1 hypothetical protein AMR74_08345 [Halorubrum tropicale]TKX44311.1 hypothetical protein EXE50_08130 [Halorubrum sp. ARQ200]TKX50782.1 hypothetical protein EXE49_03890 [Halorubrum sp. ASP121]TKX63646.1 hypothetical protein EXE48_01255 [Halorubrum sp. ASP1]